MKFYRDYEAGLENLLFGAIEVCGCFTENLPIPGYVLRISEATFFTGFPFLRSDQLNNLQVTLHFGDSGDAEPVPGIDSFNGSFRTSVLNVNRFLSLHDSREKIEAWRQEYNTFRPHSSLNRLMPEEHIERMPQKFEFSHLDWS